jgi:hypothetical protein
MGVGKMQVAIIQFIDGEICCFDDPKGEAVASFPISELFKCSGEPDFVYPGVTIDEESDEFDSSVVSAG